MAVKLFLTVLLSRFLVAGTSNFASAKVVNALGDLKRLKSVDWGKLVFNTLQQAIIDKQKKKNAHLCGCIYVPIIMYLDNVKRPDGVDDNLFVTPRICMYDFNLIKQLTANGVYADIPLIDWKETCYCNKEKVQEEKVQEEVVQVDTIGDMQEDDEPQQRDIETQYAEYVLNRTRDAIVLDLFNIVVPESRFVKCFKPGGYMDSSILDMQCCLLGEGREDRIILSQHAARQLMDTISDRRALKTELREQKLENATRVYVPLLHAKHWFLLVIELVNETVHLIDSFPSQSRIQLSLDVLAVLRNTIRESLPFVDINRYNFSIPQVQNQQNRFDCGYHTLLYIEGFENGDIYNFDKERVEKFRKKLAVDLYNMSSSSTNRNRTAAVNTDDNDDFQMIDDSFTYPLEAFTTVFQGNVEEPDNINQRRDGEMGGKNTDEAAGDTGKGAMKEADKGTDKGGRSGDVSLDGASLDKTQEEKNVSKDKDGEDSRSGDVSLDGASSNKTQEEKEKVDVSLDKNGEDSLSGASSEKTQEDFNSGAEEKNAEDDKVEKQKKKVIKKRKSDEDSIDRYILPPGSKRTALPEDLKVENTDIEKCVSEKAASTIFEAAMNCEEQVIFSLGEVSLTGAQMKESFEGGENAINIIRAVMGCLQQDVEKKNVNKQDAKKTKPMPKKIPKLFLPPVSGDYTLEDIVKALPPKGTNLSRANIYCAVFRKKWIGYCFQVEHDQIYCLYDKSLKNEGNDITALGIEIGCKINEALEKKGHDEASFAKQLRCSLYTFRLTLPDSVAMVYFLQKFPGNPSLLKELDWKEQGKFNKWLKQYKESATAYLVTHEANVAKHSDQFSELISQAKAEEPPKKRDNWLVSP